MISLEEYKKALGEKARGFSDKEIEKARNDHYILADIIFDIWKKEKNLENK